MQHRLLFWGLVVAALGFTAETAFAQAQNYQPIRVDSGLSGTYVSASGRGGFGAMVEPKFYVHDNIAVGGRIEAAVMFGGEISSNGDTKMDMGAVGAVMAKGEYLLGTSGVRPFVGLGIGMFDIAGQSIETSSGGNAGIDQKAGRYFGIAPQVGVDLGRMRLAASYNAILGADIEVRQMVGNVEQTSSFSQNYLTFEMSFRFGGRKKARALPPPVMAAPPPAPAPMAPPAAPPGETPAASPTETAPAPAQ